MPDTALRLKREFAAPRERVFEAWTNPEKLKQWWGPNDYTSPNIFIDLRVGGKYRLEMTSPDGDPHVVVGTYREVASPEKLVFTWQLEGADMDETLVTIEFVDRGNATEVVLLHERFTNETLRSMHIVGWTASLDKLGQML